MTSQQFPEPIYLHLKPVLILRIERGGTFVNNLYRRVKPTVAFFKDDLPKNT